MAQRDWQGELSQALGLTPEGRPAAAPAAGPGDAPRHAAAESGSGSGWQLEHRLARIEALLDADLDRLGEAVLGATISRLDARLSALVDRVDAVLAPRPSDEAGGSTESSTEGSGDAGSGESGGDRPIAFAELPVRDRALSEHQYDEITRRLDTLAERLDELVRDRR